MGARFVQTTRDKSAVAGSEPPPDPVLVIAHHPSLARVGDAFVLRDRITELGRLTPLFGGAGDTSPLDDPFVSRTSLTIRRLANDELEIDNRDNVELAIAGVPIRTHCRVTAGQLAAGIDLVLGGRVVIWLTTTRAHVGLSDELGMVGASTAIADLRLAIRELASPPTRGPILVLGETGTGKELVARAIHACVRPDGPYAAVNIAAIPAAVATAELFGHEKGAFTGATERRAGYFERSSSGVLFVDEIGDLADAIQPILLRALESGEIQPVGGTPRLVDTLVVAATDADLDHAVATNRFRGPLYHRLAAIALRVPPLRERRGDIGPLLARFLSDELALGHPALDRTTDANAWLPASVVADSIRAAWPGNIRQLRGVALRLAAIARAHRTATLDALGSGLGIEDVSPDQESEPLEGAAMRGRGWSERAAIDEATLAATLRQHRFHLARTAEALGISRTHLDSLIASSKTLRKAKDLDADQITACRDVTGDDLDAMAAKLEVSPRGLRLRMRQLGLD